MKSGLFSLKAVDFFKGLILFVGTPVLILIQQLIPSWTPLLTEHLGQTGGVIAQAALSALVAYLIKNYFTPTVTQAVKIVQKASNASQESVIITPKPIIANQ